MKAGEVNTHCPCAVQVHGIKLHTLQNLTYTNHSPKSDSSLSQTSSETPTNTPVLRHTISPSTITLDGSHIHY